jgi:hypothetical protein
MFNNKGESKMFLIIERIEYGTIDHSFNIAQNTENKSKAEEYKKALETLHADDENKKSFSIVEVA